MHKLNDLLLLRLLLSDPSLTRMSSVNICSRLPGTYPSLLCCTLIPAVFVEHTTSYLKGLYCFVWACKQYVIKKTKQPMNGQYITSAWPSIVITSLYEGLCLAKQPECTQHRICVPSNIILYFFVLQSFLFLAYLK